MAAAEVTPRWICGIRCRGCLLYCKNDALRAVDAKFYRHVLHYRHKEDLRDKQTRHCVRPSLRRTSRSSARKLSSSASLDSRVRSSSTLRSSKFLIAPRSRPMVREASSERLTRGVKTLLPAACASSSSTVIQSASGGSGGLCGRDIC